MTTRTPGHFGAGKQTRVSRGKAGCATQVVKEPQIVFRTVRQIRKLRSTDVELGYERREKPKITLPSLGGWGGLK